MLWPHSPEALGYLGCRLPALKSTQLRTIKAVLKAIRGLPIELVIKPHYFEDEPQWRTLLRGQEESSQVKLAKCSDDFATWLKQSDVMLVSYWSTALIEAGMAGVPIIYADLDGHDSSAVRDYSAEGFCEVAKSDEELRALFEKRCRSGFAPRPLPTEAVCEHYFGKRDGKNTARVVEHLL